MPPTTVWQGSVGGGGQTAAVSTRYVIDETKAKGYVLVAVACPDDTVRSLRQSVSELVLPRQRSLHMKSESSVRRKAIAGAIAALSLDVSVIDASTGAGREPDRRRRALAALIGEVGSDTHLVFDRDETMEAIDRRYLSSLPFERRPSYVHVSRHEEPLLALPDVIAWCWARGGDWRRLLLPLALKVTDA